MTEEIKPKVDMAEVYAIMADEIRKMQARNVGSAERNPDTGAMMREAYASVALAEKRTRERVQRLFNVAAGGGNA
jgi:hypothetical protein